MPAVITQLSTPVEWRRRRSYDGWKCFREYRTPQHSQSHGRRHGVHWGGHLPDGVDIPWVKGCQPGVKLAACLDYYKIYPTVSRPEIPSLMGIPIPSLRLLPTPLSRSDAAPGHWRGLRCHGALFKMIHRETDKFIRKYACGHSSIWLPICVT